MSKIQSRRTISYNRELFERAKERAAQLRVPLSSFAEHAIERLIADGELKATDIISASVGRGVYARASAGPPRRRQEIGSEFTWRGRVHGEPPPARPKGLSRQAAEWMVEHGGTLQSAADRFGCSRQAVSQAVLAVRVAEAKRESAEDQS